KGAYSIKADAFHSTIANYIQGEEFSVNAFGAAGQPARPAYIGPGPAVRLAAANNRPTDIHTHGGELEFRAKPSRFFSAIVGYAYQTNDLVEATDRQGAYTPKHKVTLIL